MAAILRKLGAMNRTQAVPTAGKLALDPETVAPPPEDDWTRALPRGLS
jgi:hypothetical protein